MKTRFVLHRVNTIAQLNAIPELSWGCEIDLRSNLNNTGSLHLAHDPWVTGENFEEWIAVFCNKKLSGPLILNTKEDGLEERALDILKSYDIDNFFFLDTTLPTTVKLADKGLRKIAVRYSTYEPLALAEKFKGKLDWLWIDCFSFTPMPMIEDLKMITGLKLCLVSPELQGGSIADIKTFAAWGQTVDAICTKIPSEWQKLL
jgi:hypothetical protein